MSTKFIFSFIIALALNVSIVANAGSEPAPQANYIAGGVVGTVVGLGIGQAINGNYANTGWIFTAFEGVLGVGMMVTGFVVSYLAMKEIIPELTPGEFMAVKPMLDRINSGNFTPNPDADTQSLVKKAVIFGSVGAAGALIFLAFRIWDIVDVWDTPVLAENPAQHHVSFAIMPYADSEVSGLSFRF